MSSLQIRHLLATSIMAAGSLAMAPHAAHAGIITGSWDPEFGPYLPGLSWAARAEFYVPDTCSAQADGDYANAGACAGSVVNNAFLRLYDTAVADPNNFFEVSLNSSNTDFENNGASPGYQIFDIRVRSGQVVGVNASRADIAFFNSFLTPIFSFYTAQSSVNNIFGMTFSLAGPDIWCLGCDNVNGYPTGFNNGNPAVYASKAELEQFLVTYTDAGPPKLSDGLGNPIGARLDGEGNFLGLGTASSTSTVPEPGSLALALAALGALVGLGWRGRSERQPARP